MVGSGRIFPAVSVSPDPSAVVPVMNLACFVFPPKTSCSESLFVRAGSCVRFLWNFSFFQSLNENNLSFHAVASVQYTSHVFRYFRVLPYRASA